MITLEQLLESRDRRAERQRSLLALYPGRTLLCLTVMLPGPVKRSSSSLRIASAAVAAVRSTFDLQFEELRDLETGYEGYFIVDLDPISAKRLAVSLEEEHPLGRLFDLDVIVPASFSVPSAVLLSASSNMAVFEDRTAVLPSASSNLAVFEDGVRPLGRQELGLPQRLCLICGKPVRECMRTRAHSTEELLKKISEICTSTSSLETPMC